MQVGRYEVLGEVARGGVGVLYRARDPQGRTVALKVLQLEHEATKRRFAREARSMAKLQHPNIARYYDAGEHQGHSYLVLEFVEGRSLEERLGREGPLPVEDVRRIGLALCDALSAVHAAGLLHRDLKPANVLENVAGRIVLTDFGLVKQNDAGKSQTLSVSVVGGILGTPGYWPPEQAHGRLDQIGPHSDVYALAATLYALLSGEPPRGGENLVEVLQRTEAPVAPLRPLRPDVPATLERGLLRALAVSPEERPSLAELRDSLAGTSPAPAGAPARGPALFALLAAVVVLSAALAWLLWPTASQDPTDTPLDPPTDTPLDPPTDTPLDPPTDTPLDPPTDTPPDPPTDTPPDPPPDTLLAPAHPELILPAHGAHVSMVGELAVSPDGSQVLTGSVTGELRLWDAGTGELLESWTDWSRGIIQGVAFGPGGMRYALTESGSLVRIGPQGDLSVRPSGHPRAYEIDVNAAGDLVTAGSDGFKLWSAAEANGSDLSPRSATRQSIQLARFAPDGSSGLAMTREAAWRWTRDGEVQREERILPGNYTDLAWSPDGTLLALLEHEHWISLYTWPALERLSRARVHRPPPGELADHAGSRSLCFGPQGERIYTVGIYPQVRSWSVPSLESAQGGFYPPWQPWTSKIRLSANGSLIAGGNTGQLLAFSTVDPKPIWRRATQPLLVRSAKGKTEPTRKGMAWLDSEGRTLLLSAREGIQALDIASGRRFVQGRRPIRGIESMLVFEDTLYGLTSEGKAVRAAVELSETHLEVSTLRILGLDPPATLNDLKRVGDSMFLVGTPGDDPSKAVVWWRGLASGRQEGRIGPIVLGGSSPLLGDSLPGTRIVFAGGETHLLRIDLSAENRHRRRDLEQPLLYAAQLTNANDMTLIVQRDGAWQWGSLETGEGLAGTWAGVNEVRSISPVRVAVNYGRLVQVFDFERKCVIQQLPIPVGDFALSTLGSPSGDALYVWTFRGEVWRLPLPR